MFDLEKFKEEYYKGDIWGLEYMERTLIRDMREKNKGTMDLTREDYIIGLFNAVMSLNWCNNIFETTDVENKFNWDYYWTIKSLLFEELGIEV